MHHKNIKHLVRKQLKKQYQNWNHLNKKTKREIARKISAEYDTEFDFNQDVAAPREKLLGIEQQVPAKGLINHSEMVNFIDEVHNVQNCKVQ